MNTNRLLIGLVIALVVAFVLSSFVYKQFQKASIIKPTSTQTLVVAAVPLPLGTRLDASNTRLIQWHANQQVAGMFTRMEDVANRAIITPLAENEPVLEAKLSPKESGAGMPSTIPEGMRALSVAVNEVVGVAGFVIPGTTVDVLVTGHPPTSDGDITTTVLQNMLILSSGTAMQADARGQAIQSPSVTILATPDQAELLTLAGNDGKIQLVLRNSSDQSMEKTGGRVVAELYGNRKPPAKHGTSAVKSYPPNGFGLTTTAWRRASPARTSRAASSRAALTGAPPTTACATARRRARARPSTPRPSTSASA